ncbi:ABC transporter substrate-binding protein [Novosphingobium sp. BL-8A]|uniref:ABC transporter substrate-binding protein n=1 Tax=Novosphingobium sp. BL-8A TaxID=3127639 RepID=UPI003756D74F
MIGSRTGLPAFAFAAALALAGCGSSSNSALSVAVIGEAGDPFGTGLQRPLAGQLTHAATTEGLVSFDEKGRVIPALADRWIVTDDGLSYIFRLRDGNWLTGDPLTAQSAKRALDSALDALKDTPLELDLAGIDETRAMAGRVIEIRLRRPMPYLLQLIAQPELGLVHKDRGAGPMRLERDQAIARMVPIDPSRLGLPAIENWARRTRRVDLRALGGPAAVNAFNDGKVDIVMGGEIQDFPLTRSVGILRGTIQLDPVVGLFGLQVMNDKGFLADPANREAIAMAIDRDALIAPFGVGGWTATTRLVTPSLDGDLGTIGERWTNQSMDERRGVAAARVRRWEGNPAPVAAPLASSDAQPVRLARKIFQRSPKAPASTSLAERAPQLVLWLPGGEGADTLFDKLSSDMAAIGIRLVRTQDAATADLALVDDIARYPRAAWFLNRLSCRARHGICSTEADARAEEAAVTQSPAERASLLAEAEAELTAANVFIPFGTPIRWSLVRGSVDGFAPNTWGWHPLMPLAWVPK